MKPEFIEIKRDDIERAIYKLDNQLDLWKLVINDLEGSGRTFLMNKIRGRKPIIEIVELTARLKSYL